MDLATPHDVGEYVRRLQKFAVLHQRDNQCGFLEGDKVRKKNGYPFDSTVVSVFKSLDGEVRLVCESDAVPGLLHIFAPPQMELAAGPDEGQLALV